MAGINRWEGFGMVNKPGVRAFDNGGTVQNFTVIVKGAEYSKEAKGDVVSTTWVSCENWLPDDYTPQQVLHQGDYVYVIGELTQQERDGAKHTRVKVLQLTVTRRGRAFRDSTGGAPARPADPAPQQDAAPNVQDDPWAMPR